EIPCYCGKQGCIETFISGTGFATDYQRLSGNTLKGDEIIRLVGGLTTFSTFSAEVVFLLQEGRFGWALLNVLINLLGSFAMTAL
ncbi:ROK family protein, partial [Salmonella enterica subsp. enterica serovar Montevideo]|nr:ROK family protein [Salmonella enterica subsp. enterica serovar Montevideo]